MVNRLRMPDELMFLDDTIYKYIKGRLNQGKSEAELMEDSYLNRHYSSETIANLICYTLEKLKWKQMKAKIVKKHAISVRLSDFEYNLLQGNKAEAARKAIIEVYARKNPKNDGFS